MADTSIDQYVRRMLASGHSIAEIESLMLSQGYTSDQARQIITNSFSSQISPITTQPHHKHPLLMIMLLIMIIVITGVVVYVVFPPSDTTSPTVKLSLNVPVTPLDSKSPLEFTRSVTLSSGNQPVRVSYTIRNSNNEIVHTYAETILPGSPGTVSLRLAQNTVAQGGELFIEAVAQIGSSSAKQTASFTMLPISSVSSTSLSSSQSQQTTSANSSSTASIPIPSTSSSVTSDKFAERPSCADGKKNGDETGIDCGGTCYPCVRQCPLFISDDNECTFDVCNAETNYRVIHQDIVPCCGNNICDPSETKESCASDCNTLQESYFDMVSVQSDNLADTSTITQRIDMNAPLEDQIDDVIELSYTDINSASAMCAAITLPYYTDECFYRLASEHGIEDFCEKIKEVRTADKCYTKLSVFHEKSSFCELVNSDLRRDSCYMRFALNGDHTVCDSITNEYYMGTCMQLRSLKQQQLTAEINLSPTSDSSPESLASSTVVPVSEKSSST